MNSITPTTIFNYYRLFPQLSIRFQNLLPYSKPKDFHKSLNYIFHLQNILLELWDLNCVQIQGRAERSMNNTKPWHNLTSLLRLLVFGFWHVLVRLVWYPGVDRAITSLYNILQWCHVVVGQIWNSSLQASSQYLHSNAARVDEDDEHRQWTFSRCG